MVALTWSARPEKLAARRVSVLECELIFLEDGFASVREAGGEPDPATLDLYGRLADRQRRLADPLGWHRAQREVSWRDKWLSQKNAPVSLLWSLRCLLRARVHDYAAPRHLSR